MLVPKVSGNPLAVLDEKLLHNSYVAGFAPTQADAVEFGKLTGPVDATKFPNVARWQRHIASFTDAQRAAFAH